MVRDYIIVAFAFLIAFICIGVVINITLTSNNIIVGQVSDTKYNPQVFGTVSDSTTITFYSGESYIFKGDLMAQLEASKVYTIKYHQIIIYIFTYNVADSIEEGFNVGSLNK